MFGFMRLEKKAVLTRERTMRLYDYEKKSSAKPIYQSINPGEALPTKAIPEVFLDDDDPWKKRIFDPGSDVMIKWNHVFLTTGLIALFIDPLYFYLSSIENGDQISCVKKMDWGLRLAVTICRSIADTFYLLHIFFKFRTAFIAPNSRVFGRGELVMDPKQIAKRYLKTEFFIDLAAALPLPQIVVWLVIPGARHLNPQKNNTTLALIVLIQYIPRLYLIFPMSQQIIKATGVVTKTAWAGAAYNLLLYMIASNVIGAAYYLLTIDRQTTCWNSKCRLENGTSGAPCKMEYLDCDFISAVDPTWVSNTSVFANCNASDDSISFNFGIYQNALTTGAVSTNFFRKYFYSLWWGLQNLSTFGQGLTSSTFVWETSFCILIALLGLILFAHLIGNMETYLQSVTIKLEEWRLKRRDTEQWMRHRQLPQELRERVKRFVQYKWFATRGVDEESLLQDLPGDLRRDIQRHLCLDLVRRVPFFSQMDDPLLDAICERLVSSLNTEGTYIVREGDPVTEMLFVMRGKLESSTTNGGRTGFFNSIVLRAGDFCGEELLSWAILPTTNLPSSTRTVRALVEVEAFALRAEDLNFVASQFRRLHSKKLQHTFRFYSQHWRTWAACFIQASWRRYKRKMSNSLSLSESFSSKAESLATHESEEETGRSPSNSSHLEQNIGAMMLPFKFSTSTRKGAQRRKGVDISKLRKPDEPDFSAHDYD
ncbi:cyclic nucleotide-gated ion channel 17 [Dendrobium catenatum]|uniref:Putative cyclic nucleotide-gated ion channel 17 n=1 Tax=Dendrobium catenatum TaxID=906689 RepID=A0A2I0VH24_9ASPA|nr:cyclic nucleotide-gated ion channel 17 [Dendrobium catenatum]PKU62711.1 putative cyclic nucleotide-gated ion channel 17 [Dendrobium catenatum]